MNITVVVRPIPEWEKPRFNLQTGVPEVAPGTAVGLLAWGEGIWVLNPSDRAALDAAMNLVEGAAATRDGRNLITVLAMAEANPAAAPDVLYEALARGANRAILLPNDDGGDDAMVRAAWLAAAVGVLDGEVRQDAVLCGAMAPDGSPDVLAPLLAAALGWPQQTAARQLTVTPGGRLVASVGAAGLGTRRYTYAQGIMTAYGQPERLEQWDRARLGTLAPEGTAPRITIRRNTLADAPTGERLTGPVEESIAVLLQGLKGQGLL